MFNKEDIMKIEFVERIGDHKFSYVALFNKNNATEEDAKEAIRTFGLGHHPLVIILAKDQFENVFGG